MSTSAPFEVEITYCIPDDQTKHLPVKRRAPNSMPSYVPLPRQGEVIYLSSTSAWGVTMVIHEWRSALQLTVQVWLEHVSSSRLRRPTGFSLTQ